MSLQSQLKTDLDYWAIGTWSLERQGLHSHPRAELHEFTIAPLQDTVQATGGLGTLSSPLYAPITSQAHQASE